MAKGPVEGRELSPEQQSKNFLYDFNALVAFFKTGTYDVENVQRALGQYEWMVNTRYAGLGREAKVMTRFPGIEADVDVRALFDEMRGKTEEMYQEREPYIVAGIMYFSLMQRVQWDLVRFVDSIKKTMEFLEGVESGEMDGEALRIQVEGVMRIPLNIYIEAYRKLNQDLEEVRAIMMRCQGQIPPLDGLLAEESANLGVGNGLAN